MSESYKMELNDNVVEIKTLSVVLDNDAVTKWLEDYDTIMKGRRPHQNTHVLIDTNSITVVNPGIRRLIGQKGFTDIYPALGYTVVFGVSREVNAAVKFSQIASNNENRLQYFVSKQESLDFLKTLN